MDVLGGGLEVEAGGGCLGELVGGEGMRVYHDVCVVDRMVCS